MTDSISYEGISLNLLSVLRPENNSGCHRRVGRQSNPSFTILLMFPVHATFPLCMHALSPANPPDSTRRTYLTSPLTIPLTEPTRTTATGSLFIACHRSMKSPKVHRTDFPNVSNSCNVPALRTLYALLPVDPSGGTFSTHEQTNHPTSV